MANLVTQFEFEAMGGRYPRIIRSHRNLKENFMEPELPTINLRNLVYNHKQYMESVYLNRKNEIERIRNYRKQAFERLEKEKIEKSRVNIVLNLSKNTKKLRKRSQALI